MSKIMTMCDAVARFVPQGSSVVMGAALESLIPFAAGHEIIRRQVCDLTLIGVLRLITHLRRSWLPPLRAGSGTVKSFSSGATTRRDFGRGKFGTATLISDLLFDVNHGDLSNT